MLAAGAADARLRDSGSRGGSRAGQEGWPGFQTGSTLQPPRSDTRTPGRAARPPSIPAEPRPAQRESPSRLAASPPDSVRRLRSGRGRVHPRAFKSAPAHPARPTPAPRSAHHERCGPSRAAAPEPHCPPRTAGLAPAARARTASRAARPPRPGRLPRVGPAGPPRPASRANHPRSRRTASLLSASPSAAWARTAPPGTRLPGRPGSPALPGADPGP